MTRDTVRTAQNDEIFFTALANGHSVCGACSSSGYSKATVYLWRRDDEDFREQWEQAKAICADLLEDEADRRGRDGYDRPVFHNGKHIGNTRVYSDALLIARLKAELPEKYGNASKREEEQKKSVSIFVRDITLEAFVWNLLEEGRIARSDFPARLLERLEKGRGNDSHQTAKFEPRLSTG